MNLSIELDRVKPSKLKLKDVKKITWTQNGETQQTCLTIFVLKDPSSLVFEMSVGKCL